jgi:hypothetical protein
MRRYLPLALLVTLLVAVLPAIVAAAIVPAAGPLWTAASIVLAVGLSMTLAGGAAALWKRELHACDVVFADLLIWGWLRRCWTERRLSQARALYDSARKSGPRVSIELLTGLSRLLEARDPYTHGHSQRVSRHAGQVAAAMHLSPVEIARIRTAAAVHDVGKLYTPREILNNPRRLTTEEFDVAKRHAAWGARMLSEVGDPEIEAMVRHHHERIDGTGYPDRLAGEEIPLGARIIAVADTFDAMTSSRVYRAGCTQKRALDVLGEEAGRQLDADAVAAFLSVYSARRPAGWLALAVALPQRLLALVPGAVPGVGLGAGGVASLLPGIGAASLLALSPAVHRVVPVTRLMSRPAAVTQSHGSAPTGSSRARRSTGTTPGSPLRRADFRRGSVAPPQSPARSPQTPSAAGGPTGLSGAGASGPDQGVPAPEAGTPPVSPEPSPVPAPVVAPVPSPAPTPPVPVPTVPEVKLPPLPVPSVPAPGASAQSELPRVSVGSGAPSN